MEEDPRLKVLNYFIRNTPVGELKEMMRDIRVLVPAEVLEVPEFAQCLSSYYEQHGLKVPVDTQIALISDAGKIEGRYFDPKIGKSFVFDPFTEGVLDVQDIEPQSGPAAELQTKLEEYLADHYNPEAIVRVYAKEGVYLIKVFCQVVNLRNYWTGEWVGAWEVRQSQLTGSVSINAHYFEEGNLQMRHRKEFDQQLPEGVDAELIVKTIKQCEQTLQTELQTLYEELPQGSLKMLRRALPVTRTKFADNPKSKMLS